MGTFVIYKDNLGQFRFNLRSINGQIILNSEGYTGKSGCENGIKSVQTNSQIDDRYERLTAKNGKPYFNLNATNGQVIGISQMYSSTSSMEYGIESVKLNAPIADIMDDS